MRIIFQGKEGWNQALQSSELLTRTKIALKRKNPNRGKIEIVGNILEASTEGVKKTNLMNRCSLSHKQVIQYLEELQMIGLIKQSLDDEGKPIYLTTESGRKFLDYFRIMMDLMNRPWTESFEMYVPHGKQATTWSDCTGNS